MSLKLLSRWLKRLVLLLVGFAILGLEPAIYPLIHPQQSWYDNPKLLMDTRSQLALKHKQRIFGYLDQAASGLTPYDRGQLVEFIYRESQEQGVNPRLIVALIQTESSFRNGAHSVAGARGLMQLRLSTAQEVAQEMGIKWKGSKSLHQPQLNIRMGAYYFAKMLQRFEDLELALTAYNIGPTAVGRLILSRADIPQKYSRRVLKHYRLLKYSQQETL